MIKNILEITSMNNLSDSFLSVTEIAALLNAKEKTVRQWVYQRKIPFLKINGLLRFSKRQVLNWIYENK